jgi:hypothetical protein
MWSQDFVCSRSSAAHSAGGESPWGAGGMTPLVPRDCAPVYVIGGFGVGPNTA